MSQEIQNQETQPQDTFFALDIGTRSVIGVIGIIENDLVRILDIESIDHPKRAMIDGQIEDIEQVSKIANLVKSNLEKRQGFRLTRVNVAAAGRALKTIISKGELQLNRDSVIDISIVRSLETDAITKANAEILNEHQDNIHSQFFCVGYSVMKYYLDDYVISTLIGHKGDTAKVEMIVTFLPNEVVESLYSAMNGIELQVESLTLEPIAAMNAVIPQELRSLNLALVDIGAGTSDIAISNNGSVVAYAMATIAGDEITEIITKEYLVDFETAEKMKHDLSLNTADISYEDVLGNEYTIPTAEVFKTVIPALEHLTNVVCEKILEVNGTSPSAVFLVGGASKIPSICKLVAKKLSIDEKKVAVGGNKPLKKTIVSDCDVFNPEFVTPLGIIITAVKSVTDGDLIVTVNGERVTLFHRAGVTMMDLLLSAGFRYNQMLGTSGKSLIYTLNDEKKICRGTYPTPATLSVNGETSSLFMPINGGDEVIIEPAISGKDASLKVCDIVSGNYDIPIQLNEKPFTVGTRIMRKDLPLTGIDKIYQNDIIYTIELRNIFDLCDYLKLDIDKNIFSANGEVVNGGYTFKYDDAIHYAKQIEKIAPLEEIVNISEKAIDHPVIDDIETAKTIEIQEITKIVEIAEVPEKDIVTETEIVKPAKHGHSAVEINDILMHQRVRDKVSTGGIFSTVIQITLNGSKVELEPKVDNSPYLFFDMLNLVNIDPSKPEGDIVLKHNNEEATFMSPVNNGDTIDIYWQS